MTRAPLLADIVFGPGGTISGKELKALYRSAAGKQLKQALKASGAKLKLPGVWSMICQSFPALFQISAADLLVQVWDRLREIGAALFPAESKADATITVPLHDYTFRSEHQPRIEVQYRGLPLTSLEFVFTLSLRFKSLLLVFRGGEMVQLQPGTCSGSARLRYGDFTILDRKIIDFTWPGHLAFAKEPAQTASVLPQSTVVLDQHSGPHLPEPKKRRGCGCFLVLLGLGLIAAGGWLYWQDPEMVWQISRQLLALFGR